jgi:hypothetical protein
LYRLGGNFAENEILKDKRAYQTNTEQNILANSQMVILRTCSVLLKLPFAESSFTETIPVLLKLVNSFSKIYG